MMTAGDTTSNHHAAKTYADELRKLERLLTRQSLTAAQIAKRTGCSVPAAHRRIRSLVEAGKRVETAEKREGSRGPLAVGYKVVTDDKPAARRKSA